MVPGGFRQVPVGSGRFRYVPHFHTRDSSERQENRYDFCHKCSLWLIMRHFLLMRTIIQPIRMNVVCKGSFLFDNVFWSKSQYTCSKNYHLIVLLLKLSFCNLTYSLTSLVIGGANTLSIVYFFIKFWINRKGLEILCFHSRRTKRNESSLDLFFLFLMK